MLRRWHVLLLILVTLTAFCGLAAAKLRGTPKYDRLWPGMPYDEAAMCLRPCIMPWHSGMIDGEKTIVWECEEGSVELGFASQRSGPVILTDKSITRRGPLERLAWLAGWH